MRSRKLKAAPARNIGIPMQMPVKRCEDRFCPYHGKLSVRGIILDVQLVSKRMQGTVVVKRERRHYINKYQRYEKRTSRYLAHMPPCMDFEVGEMVRIAECRPLSKATSFVVIGGV
ncbi:MAG: 30S ribosomal protein S17 [Candidatus Thermoplasmatota archaeon]|nr:30S ribosomal protein S17 [Candidatus Thermoplasmatota archaeon]